MSADVNAANDWQPGQWAAFNGMDGRLVLWGEVLLQGAKGDEPNARDERPPIPKKVWSAGDEAAAWATDRLVRELKPRDQAVLRTFYKAREARYWDEIAPDKQAVIYAVTLPWFNYRWRIYCAEIATLPVTLRGYHFKPVRDGAILQLCDLVANKPLDSHKIMGLNCAHTCLGNLAR